MKICLHKCEENKKYGPVLLEIKHRLPFNLKKVSDVECIYTIKRCRDYYLLELEVSANTEIECQRCLQDFTHHYNNKSNIAVCKSEEVAEKVLTEHESLVSANNEVDLTEIVTDDLHLFCPEKHEKLEFCALK